MTTCDEKQVVEVPASEELLHAARAVVALLDPEHQEFGFQDMRFQGAREWPHRVRALRKAIARNETAGR